MPQFHTSQIERVLSQSGHRCTLKVFDSLASTNATAKQMAKEGAPDGLVVIAEHQSAGRGRLQRSFFSPDGTGLYMSLLVRRPLRPTVATRLTAAAAVCTAQAIERLFDRKADIKWVNDIYLDGKKACGILSEAALTPDGNSLAYAVIGIGVNVYAPKGGFPEEIASVATAVLEDSKMPDARERLAAEIITGLLDALDRLEGQELYEEYRCRSYLLGRHVRIHGGIWDGQVALAEDIDRDFHLIVRLESGELLALDSGEVSVKE